MEKIIILVVVALIAESVWETLKMTWQNGKVIVDRVGALVVSILLAVGTKLDILDLVGIEVGIPMLGIILTGILISRGSNFIHDLVSKLNYKVEAEPLQFLFGEESATTNIINKEEEIERDSIPERFNKDR